LNRKVSKKIPKRFLKLHAFIQNLTYRVRIWYLKEVCCPESTKSSERWLKGDFCKHLLIVSKISFSFYILAHIITLDTRINFYTKLTKLYDCQYIFHLCVLQCISCPLCTRAIIFHPFWRNSLTKNILLMFVRINIFHNATPFILFCMIFKQRTRNPCLSGGNPVRGER